MGNIVSDVMAWYLSCPSVIVACLVWFIALAAIFGLLGLAREV